MIIAPVGNNALIFCVRFLRFTVNEKSLGYPLGSLRCSRPTLPSKPLNKYSPWLYAEGLERQRRKQSSRLRAHSAPANARALCSRRGGVWEQQWFSNLFPSFGTYSPLLPVFQEPITIIGQKAHLDFFIDTPLEAR